MYNTYTIYCVLRCLMVKEHRSDLRSWWMALTRPLWLQSIHQATITSKRKSRKQFSNYLEHGNLTIDTVLKLVFDPYQKEHDGTVFARKIHMNIPEASINRALKHVFVSVSSFDKKSLACSLTKDKCDRAKSAILVVELRGAQANLHLRFFCIKSNTRTCSVSVQGGPGAQILSRVDLWRVGW